MSVHIKPKHRHIFRPMREYDGSRPCLPPSVYMHLNLTLRPAGWFGSNFIVDADVFHKTVAATATVTNAAVCPSDL